MKKMKKNYNDSNELFWRRWWDSRSQQVSSDSELDRISTSKDEFMDKFAEQELLTFVKPIHTDSIFDVGCGTGIDISRLNVKVNKIVGMDHSEGIIKRCFERLEDENIANTKLFVGSVTNLAIKTNTFDKIICMSVLHYLNTKECEAAIKEIIRVSKVDSLIIFHVKNLFSMYSATLFLAKKIKLLFSKRVIFEHYRTFNWYKNVLFKYGAEIVDFNSTNKFNIEFFPKFLNPFIKKLELKYYYSRLLRKYGSELKLKVVVKKK